jgi:hypothetical protein
VANGDTIKWNANYPIYTFKLEGWNPGNKFTVKLISGEEVNIMIGITGTYELKTPIPINSITSDSNNSVSNPKASITYSYKGTVKTNFDKYKAY